MKSFLANTWNRLRGTAKEPVPPEFAATVMHPAAGPPPPVSETPKVDMGMAPAAIGARRPLISASEGVVGFEFRVSSELRDRFRRKPNPAAQLAHAAAVLTSARLTAGSGRIGLARLPADWLCAKVDFRCEHGVMVALDRPTGNQTIAENAQGIEQGLLALRAAGAKVGWPVEMTVSPARDFVLMRQGDSTMSTVLASVEQLPASLQGLPILVTDVSHLEDLELALGNSIDYVCGAMVQREQTAPRDALPLSPEARRIGLLLQQIVTGAETQAIVEQIKGDVGLSYRLLRRLKGADMAHLQGCESIDQAVQLLGRNELYRWLSILLLKSPGNRKIGLALHEVALWRAELLELLAVQRNEATPGQLFTLGLASMLGPLLRISLQEVVSTLNLNAQGQQALLEDTGPWAAYLQISRALETHTLDKSAGLTEAFGGTKVVSELSDQAWLWATASVGQAKNDQPVPA